MLDAGGGALTRGTFDQRAASLQIGQAAPGDAERPFEGCLAVDETTQLDQERAERAIDKHALECRELQRVAGQGVEPLE